MSRPLPTLTRARLIASVGVSAVVAAGICILAPLIGVEDVGGGRDLYLLDLGAVFDGLDGPANPASQLFVYSRLPRVLAGAVVGAGLAAAGCVFQALLRNPLAEPYTLGVSSGAAFAALIAIRFHFDDSPFGSSAIGLAALAGALATVWVVWRLARVGRELPPATLLLAGVTIALFCGAASMVVQYTASFTELYRFVSWLMGGLATTLYGPVLRAAVPTVLGIGVLLYLSRDLNAMSAGREAAASVGVDGDRTTAIGFFVASTVVGAGISIAGPIGFVGLIVPHLLRGVVGPDHRVLLPTCVFTGAGFVVACDTVARVVLRSGEFPVGVITALLGGPFFLYLIVREKGRGRLWGG